MSFAETWGRPGVGILPLQHRDYDKKGWDLAMRAGKHAVRVTDRLDTGSDQGHWVFDLDTAGDMPQWLCWPNKKGGEGRQIPGWAQVWPAMIQAVAGGKNDVATPGNGGGGGGGQSVPTQGSGSIGSPVPTPDVPSQDPGSMGDVSFIFYNQNPDSAFGGAPIPNVGGSPSFNVSNNQNGQNQGQLTLGIGGGQIYINGQPASSSGFAQFSLGGSNALANLSGIQGVGTGSSFATFTYGGSSSLSSLTGLQGVGTGSRFAGFSFGGSSSTSALTGIPGIGFHSGFAGFFDPSAPGSGIPNGGFNIGAGQDALRGGGVQNLLGGGINGPQGGLGALGLPGDPGAATKQSCGTFNGQQQILPLNGYEMKSDDRYAPLTPIMPNGPGLPKFSASEYGLVVSATNEEKQIEYFFPTWTGRLIAVNQAGDPKMGTLVCDLNAKFGIDPGRTSPLQSMMRVVNKPMGGPNAISWTIGESGCGDVRGGFVGEKPEGGGAHDHAFGLASYNDGGPFCVGSKTDKHRRGLDADNHVINSLHIKTTALFRQDDVKDGPLRFEQTYLDGEDFTVPVRVHLGWTGNDWAWYTTALFYVPIDPLKPNPLKPRYPVVPTGSVVPGMPLTPTQGSGTTRPGTPAIPGWVPTVDPRYDHTTPTPGSTVTSSSVGSTILNLVAAVGPIEAPAMVSQAQNYTAGQSNTGMFSGTNAANIAKGSQSNPVTGVMSAFGAEGGATGGGGSNTPTPQGSEGDPWVYTTPPMGQAFKGKQAKMPGGTANGGWIIHPPETDLRDARTFGMVPPNQSLSTTYFMTAPNAWFGAGTPELATGAPRSGYSWGMDTSTGDLLFRSHSFSESAANAVRFTNSSQTIQWYATRSVYGELYHFNTANRVYTFPDLSGTVALSSTGTGTFTQGSIPFGASDGSLTENNAKFFLDNTNTLFVAGDALTSGRTNYLVSNYMALFGTATAGKNGQIALVGNKTSDAAVGQITFHNEAIGSGDRRIASLNCDRNGANNSGLFTALVWNAGVAVEGWRLAPTSMVVNEAGADYDFRIEGDTASALFQTDAGTDRISSTVSDTSTTPIYDFIQSSTGDAAIRVAIGTTTSWAVGSDNSDSDSFKVSYAASGSATLGTNDFFVVTIGGLLSGNISNALTSPHLELIQASTGDSGLRFTLSGGNSYVIGIDNSDSDSWKLSYGSTGNAALGTNDYVTITTAGAATFSSTVAANTSPPSTGSIRVGNDGDDGTGSTGVVWKRTTATAREYSWFVNSSGIFTLRDRTGSNNCLTIDTAGALKVINNIGFYNTAPVAKQTVTGSRGGNAALASLLTALATSGLITDSSSA